MAQSAYPRANAHQDYQTFPRLDSPVVDPSSGMLMPAWHRLLINLFRKTGGAVTPVSTTLQVQSASNGAIQIVGLKTNQVTGAPAQVLEGTVVTEEILQSLIIAPPTGPTDPSPQVFNFVPLPPAPSGFDQASALAMALRPV